MIALILLSIVLSEHGYAIEKNSQATITVLNGFTLESPLVPIEKILSGGPPRDGIPAINKPRFINGYEATTLKNDNRILGIVINGVARAYPINIMNWHEIVNDQVEGIAFSVTYCPLCGSGIAFKGVTAGRPLTFGVSGLLFDSDVLLYDHQTESLWSQLKGQAINGVLKGNKLSWLPLEHTTWQAWKERYPRTQVLSTDTGYIRNYNRDPYQGYEESRETYFELTNEPPPRYHPKERVLGLSIGDHHRAYPFAELAKHGESRFSDNLAGVQITVHWDKTAQSAKVINSDGREIPTVTSFWFAWFTFHPDTEIFPD